MSPTPQPKPPTSICSLYFDQAQVEFDKGFNAAGYEQVLQGIECLYARGLLTDADLHRAIKTFHVLIKDRRQKTTSIKQKGLYGE